MKLLFTPQEKRVLLFIMLTFLVGGGARYFFNYRLERFEHRLDSLDQVFFLRSESLKVLAERIQKSGKPFPADTVSLNSASAAELETLPGIGPVLARRIVEFRKSHGPFNSPEDLQQVSGIGKKLWARIAPRIKL